jgi:hypothetical protein
VKVFVREALSPTLKPGVALMHPSFINQSGQKKVVMRRMKTYNKMCEKIFQQVFFDFGPGAYNGAGRSCRLGDVLLQVSADGRQRSPCGARRRVPGVPVDQRKVAGGP